MRLHRLIIEAFGPFAERVEVDFDALGSAGIFLVHGATGSGKTSLLDAICFALYAQLPGARPSGAQLRSDHADPDARPLVQVDLTVAGRRLRITRSPEHRRPKKRGTGTTPVKASVAVEERGGGRWQQVTTRADEAGDLLGQLLGMHLEQFAKVVLLPQGDFAAFLRANPEDRRAVLERLFDVSRFTDIETWLAERRRTLDRAVQTEHGRVVLAGQRLDDALSTAPETVTDGLPSWSELPPEAVAQALESTTVQLQQWAAAALADRDTAISAADLTAQAFTLGQRHNELRVRGERALAGQAELAATEKQRADDAVRLAAAERAARLGGDVRAVQAADADLLTADAEVGWAATRVSDLGLRADLGTTKRNDDEQDEHEWSTTTLARLHAHHDTWPAATRLDQSIAERARSEADLAESLTEARQAEADLTAQLDANAEQLKARTARRQELVQSAADLDTIDAEVELLERRSRVRAELDGHLTTVQQLTETHLSAVEAAQQAREELLDLRQRRLDGIAAELSSGLHDGSPCPVCGATEHPAPAAASDPDQVVSAADVEAAEARCLPLDKRVTHLAEARAAALALRDARLADLQGESRDQEELRSALRAAQDRRDTALAARDEQIQLTESIDELTEARDTALAEHAKLRARVAELDGQLTVVTDERAQDARALTALLTAHAAECPCVGSATTGLVDMVGNGCIDSVVDHAPDMDRGLRVDYDAARDRHKAAITALSDLDAARTQQQRAGTRARSARRAAEQAARDEGFASIDEALAAALPEQECDTIRAELTKAQRQADLLAAELAEPDIRAALDGDPADLDELQSSADAARRARSVAEQAHALAEAATRQFVNGADELAASVQSHTAASEHAAVASRLADAVAGLGSDNTMRMRVSAFVLAGRLERVVELANERLSRMGDGRFRLEHDDGPARRGRRSGLGLAVADLWTGRSRATETLSGGESFMASLALALGLADAVQEETGGLHLETLFVDEGFGSLDDESLDQVMTVLDGLREGGRCVGVVSHVADLRTRIPAQVHVLKDQSGSQVQLRIGA